jgi:predicted small lipoprotein YifL
MKTTRAVFFLVLIAILLITSVTGCGKTTPTVTVEATKAPTETPKPTAVPTLLASILGLQPNMPPRVVERVPAEGEEMPVGGTLSVAFDQPMDADSTASAMQVLAPDQSVVAGEVSWKNARTLVFKPEKPLETGKVYAAVFAASAKSAGGVELGEQLTLNFQTTGKLQVSQVFPAGGATDIQNKGVITVMFNRPVVPLVIAEAQADLPNPLVIEPGVEGKGEWINTSLYVFRPDGYLRGGTEYHVTVPAGLADASGDPGAALGEDYSWSFTTELGQVEYFSYNDMMNPNDQMPNVRLDPVIKIGFSVAMDRNSVENFLTLRNSASGEDVALETGWNEAGTEITLKPADLLALDSTYQLNLNGDIRALDGGLLKEGLIWNFGTLPHPYIKSTIPRDGAANANFNFTIQFASPMDFKTIKDKVIFSPALKYPDQTWYNDWEWQVMYWNLEASTNYTVEILPGMKDIYGNEIKEGQTVSFTTRAYPATANLLMPWEPVFRAGAETSFKVRYTNVNSIQVSM